MAGLFVLRLKIVIPPFWG